jgi:hypothetical protein
VSPTLWMRSASSDASRSDVDGRLRKCRRQEHCETHGYRTNTRPRAENSAVDQTVGVAVRVRVRVWIGVSVIR